VSTAKLLVLVDQDRTLHWRARKANWVSSFRNLPYGMIEETEDWSGGFQTEETELVGACKLI
jgi:hypothetical protein